MRDDDVIWEVVTEEKLLASRCASVEVEAKLVLEKQSVGEECVASSALSELLVREVWLPEIP